METTVDRAALTRDMQKLSDACNAYVQHFHMSAPIVVKRQAGLMVKTLMNITPPTNRSQTRRKINENIRKRVGQMRNPGRKFKQGTGGKEGRGDIAWYYSSHDAIYGMARDLDWRDKTADQLYSFLKIQKQIATRGGSYILKQRGKQRVLIKRRIIVDPEAVKAVIKRLASHIGRLKAGWLKAWRRLGVQGDPPEWITQHESGSRGDCDLKLEVKGEPSVVMRNWAVGASAMARNKKGFMSLERQAIAIRTKAIMKEMQLIAASKNQKEWLTKVHGEGWEAQ